MAYEKQIVAHAIDSDIRLKSSSGGFCKSFLIYLIESKRVDNVILTRMQKNSTKPESIITNNPQEILERTNSIYEYHNQLEILKEIKSDETYTFIGLPCFVRYIKSQQLNKKKFQNIYPLISILCNQAPLSSFKEQLLEDNNIQIDDVKSMDYRHGEYPGSMVAETIDRSINLGTHIHNWAKYNEPNYCHAPPCCLNCELFESVFADIVVGDPWLTEYDKSKKGWTKVIVRNEHSMQLIEDSVDKKYIYIEQLQNTFLAYKKPKKIKKENNKRC